MVDVIGTIKEISTENNNGKDKKVVTLQAGKNNTLFIEFQGKMQNVMDKYNVNQDVCIKIVFNGRESKLGRKYNNLVAKSIKEN